MDSGGQLRLNGAGSKPPAAPFFLFCSATRHSASRSRHPRRSRSALRARRIGLSHVAASECACAYRSCRRRPRVLPRPRSLHQPPRQPMAVQCSGLRSRAALRACGVGLRAWPHGRACARDSDGGTADRPGSSSVAASPAPTAHQPPLGSWQCGGLLHARRGPRCCGEARHQHGALPGLPRGWPSQARVPRLPMSSLEQ